LENINYNYIIASSAKNPDLSIYFKLRDERFVNEFKDWEYVAACAAKNPNKEIRKVIAEMSSIKNFGQIAACAAKNSNKELAFNLIEDMNKREKLTNHCQIAAYAAKNDNHDIAVAIIAEMRKHFEYSIDFIDVKCLFGYY
jgi:hypothetical protein